MNLRKFRPIGLAVQFQWSTMIHPWKRTRRIDWWLSHHPMFRSPSNMIWSWVKASNFRFNCMTPFNLDPGTSPKSDIIYIYMYVNLLHKYIYIYCIICNIYTFYSVHLSYSPVKSQMFKWGWVKTCPSGGNLHRKPPSFFPMKLGGSSKMSPKPIHR